MSFVTSAAHITCAHGGKVMATPSQATVTVQGVPVLCEPDLIGAPIVGCTQPATPSTKPCTAVVSTLPGSSSPTMTVAGRPPYMASLTGITDGIPPAPIIVVSPGQTLIGP